MRKEEMIEQIDDLKQKLEELKEQVNSIEDDENKKGVRQMPEYGERYYYVSDQGVVTSTNWYGIESDLFRFNTGNCFKTEQEAEEYKENLLTKQALKDIALELNNGIEIDWDNDAQKKYFIYFDYDTSYLNYCYAYIVQQIDIYCLNENFLTIAKERIGEDKLIKLIKSGI